MAKKPLYPWQQECLRLWFENGRRGVACVATGTGKTLLALEAAARLQSGLPGKALHVRVIVPRVFLAHQWKSEIASGFSTLRK
jgi:superfamily II DNA or RNA helicase